MQNLNQHAAEVLSILGWFLECEPELLPVVLSRDISKDGSFRHFSEDIKTVVVNGKHDSALQAKIVMIVNCTELTERP